MTVKGNIDNIKVEVNIYYAIRAIRGVQHAKSTREKVLTSLKKMDKHFQVDIFACKFQELTKRRFIEIQGEDEEESLFISRNITYFINFDKKGTPELNKSNTFPNKALHIRISKLKA